jgi:hypothetical protein
MIKPHDVRGCIVIFTVAGKRYCLNRYEPLMLQSFVGMIISENMLQSVILLEKLFFLHYTASTGNS